MRKASTTRSDRRARVRSRGGILMIVCHVSLNMEHLRRTCAGRNDVIRSPNGCLQSGTMILERRGVLKIHRGRFAMLTSVWCRSCQGEGGGSNWGIYMKRRETRNEKREKREERREKREEKR